MNSEKLLEVSNVKKYYHGYLGSKLKVLENISFSIPKDSEQKVISFLAPFGSGKTSLMKIIAALEQASEGEVILEDKKYSLPDGNIIYIPEKPSSFLWLNVKSDIEFILKNTRNKSSKDINELISMVGLGSYGNHHSHGLSYGFRFRVSLARALAVNPKIIIIDDSLKLMDYLTRKEVYEMLGQVVKKFEIKFILSTTNITEALLLSDKIFFMRKKPGTIFHEFDVERDWKDKDETEKQEKLHALKNDVINFFRAEKMNHDLSFSA